MDTDEFKKSFKNKKSRSDSTYFLWCLVINIVLVMVYVNIPFANKFLENRKKETAEKILMENEIKLARQEEERIKEEKKKIQENRKFYTQNLEWISVNMNPEKVKKWRDNGWMFYKLKHKDMYFRYFKNEKSEFLYVSFEAYATNGKKYELEFEEKNSPYASNSYGDITLSLVVNDTYEKISGICELNGEKIRLLTDMPLVTDQIKKFYDLMPDGNTVNCSFDKGKVSFDISDWQIVLFTDFSPQKGL